MIKQFCEERTQIDNDNVAQKFIDFINTKLKSLKKLNIIILGKSSFEKSTLINSLFSGSFTQIGSEKSVI